MPTHPCTLLPDDEFCYRAVSGRDPRFDGWIYVGVTSTGIYCRPSCPARTPKSAHCRFFTAPAAAQQAGFRACRRCRPDAVPGSPQWNPRADVAARAMRLIADGLVDRAGVSGLAAAVGYSERQLNRLLTAEVGAGPLAIARAQRARTARVLVDNTVLPMGDIAFAAGFASIRQFNDTLRQVYGVPPSALRRLRAGVRPVAGSPPPPIRLRLPVRRPFAAEPLFAFLGARAVAGVEDGGGAGTALGYRRSCALPHGPAVIELAMADPDAVLTAELRLHDLRDLAAAVNRIRRLLDLDADPVAVDAVLASAGPLGVLIRACPGVRVPGTVSGDELAFRALVGQQVSVAGAATTAARLVRGYGRPLPSPGHRPGDAATTVPAAGPDRLFPDAATLAAADPTELPMPAARARGLVRLAAELAAGRIDLSPGADRDEARARLLELPGVGPWTAGYIAMRALGDPDVLLVDDLIIRRELHRRGAWPPEQSRWAPWRSYATMRLWQNSRQEETA